LSVARAAPPPHGLPRGDLDPLTLAELKPVRNARFSREQVFAVVSPLTLLVLWQVLSNVRVLDPRIFSSPTAVAAIMWQLIQNGELLHHLRATVLRLIAGTLVGVVPGLVIGLIIGLFRWPRAIITPLVSAIYGLPRVALFPLVLLIVGLNETSNVIMVALGPFFTMVIGVAAGVQSVDPIYLKVARSFNVSTRDLYLKVVIPASLPIILSLLRLSLGLAILGVVAVEFLATNDGLGYLIWHSWQILSLGQSMTGLVTTGVLAYAMFVALDQVEKRALPWSNPEQR
jgi:ABC-type nitrate/sulfonate/bicarbonate transport system permease component